MTARELVVLIWGITAGRIRRDTRGQIEFTYDAAWRERTDAVPLSLSMPLAAAEHRHRIIEAFLWGLLPDNELILQRWGQDFHVSPRNAFALLEHVGEDCAGAVQFVTEDKILSMRPEGKLEVQWITDSDIEARLRALREDQAAWRMGKDKGHFSLAGSQPKTALLNLDGRWGVPEGRTPTTHILKPPIPGLDGHVENEHFCLQLALAAGLPAIHSMVRKFGAETAIVVTRYDRARTADLASAAAADAALHAADSTEAAARPPGDRAAAARAADSAAFAAAASAQAVHLRTLAATQPILRLHQEDLCQALGVPPSLKYQNEGGPSSSDIVDLIRENSAAPAEDTATILGALGLNWLIAGTDAHAKNYSLLHGAGGSVRLAPLYDIASALPYPDMDPRRIKLAMRIGSKYRVHDIGRRQWTDLAEEWGLAPEETIDRLAELINTLRAAVPEVRAAAIESGLDHPIITRLSDLLLDRIKGCSNALTRNEAP